MHWRAPPWVRTALTNLDTLARLFVDHKPKPKGRMAKPLHGTSLLVMPLQGGGVLHGVQSTSTSGGGPSGGAPRSKPVTSLTWPRNQMVNSSPRGGEFREGFLDVGTLEPNQHEASHRGLLQSPGLPGKSSPDQLSFECFASLPHARGRKVEGSPLSGPGAMRVLVGVGWSRPGRTAGVRSPWALWVG